MSLLVNAHMADAWRDRCHNHIHTHKSRSFTPVLHTHSHKQGFSRCESNLTLHTSLVTVSSSEFFSFLLDLFSLPLAEPQSDRAPRQRRARYRCMIYSPACLCLHSPQPQTYSTVHSVPKGLHVHTHTHTKSNGQTVRYLPSSSPAAEHRSRHCGSLLGLFAFH